VLRGCPAAGFEGPLRSRRKRREKRREEREKKRRKGDKDREHPNARPEIDLLVTAL